MRRFILTATICLVLFLVGGSNALAQNSDPSAPASKEDIQRYLNTTRSHDMMQSMIAAMAKPMHQMVHDQYIKDKDKLPADFETRMNKMMDDMLKDMPFDEMMQAMVPTYQKHFTKGDIDSLVAFYSSPTGQKLLKETPAIMAEAMQSMMPIMRKQMDAMNQRVQQEVAAMMKNSSEKPARTAPVN
jgi:hypothetical protein